MEIGFYERTTQLLECSQCVVIGARKYVEGQTLIVVAPDNDGREPIGAK